MRRQSVRPKVRSELGRRPGDLLDNAVRRNVLRTVDRLRTASEPLLLQPLAAGRLRIVGARYDLDDGIVDFFDPTPPPQVSAA